MVKMNTGAWIGIIGGVIGAAIGIASVITVGGSTGFYIGAGMLVMFGGMGFLFYKLIFQQMILAARLQKTGIPGKALIVDIQDTNVTINHNPQIKLILELKNTLGQKYEANVRTVISRFHAPIFQVGMTVAVLIDPKDETKMILDTNTTQRNGASAMNNGHATAMQAEMMKAQREGDTIRLMGTAAKAIIKKYTWLGIYVNGNNPYTAIEMKVLPENGPAFEGKVKVVVAEQSVAKYQPGQEIFVKYDMMDKSKVAIDHS